jgi:hypothetical protein
MNSIDNDIVTICLAVTCAIIASGGFWAYLGKRTDREDATTKLLMGLAHDTILQRGSLYLRRGYITNEEYNDLDMYLMKPYMNLGGNGMAERIMNEIKKLPVIEPENHFTKGQEDGPNKQHYKSAPE